MGAACFVRGWPHAGARLPGQVRADRPAHEVTLVEDADLRHIPRVVAQNDRFPHLGGQRRIDVAETREPDVVWMDLPRAFVFSSRQVGPRSAGNRL